MRFGSLLHVTAIAGLVTVGLSGLDAGAQSYPTKPLRLIVPQGAGGGSDIGARVIAQKLSEAIGQQVVVENRPGAGGIIGVDAAAKSAPDGYTLLLGSNTTMAANVSLYSKLPFDPVKDFTPLATAAAAHFSFVVHPSVPVNNMKELVALAKSKPGQINYGAGTSSAQICTEMLKSSAGIKLTYVPYKSSSQALSDLMAGHIQLICEPLVTAMPNVKAGKIKILAVTSPERVSSVPELPTVAEAGIPGVEYVAWIGLFAPAGIPKDVVNKLSGELLKVLKQQETMDKLKSVGFEPLVAGPEGLGALQKADIARQAKVIKEAGIKAE